jgi:hypothetical protein
MHDDTAASNTTVIEFYGKPYLQHHNEPGSLRQKDEQEMSLYVDNLLTGEDAVEPRRLSAHS